MYHFLICVRTMMFGCGGYVCYLWLGRALRKIVRKYHKESLKFSPIFFLISMLSEYQSISEKITLFTNFGEK